MIIPESERYGKLKELLFQYVSIVAKIKDSNPTLAQQWPQLFVFLSSPWIVDQTQLTNDQRGFVERRKHEIAELQFDGAEVKKQLEEVRASDRQIAECCPTLLHLANFLDTFFITQVADASRQGAPKERLDFAFDEFASITYRQGSFKRIALSHIFNFDMEGNSARFESDNPAASIRD